MIPISILTGFLGSGKTTILARLLRDPAYADTAVIINEFGDVGLDHDLIETSDETMVTLATGCLCCKIQDDLVTTLKDLIARRAAGKVPPFSRFVIETSGLSDPAPILQGMMIDAELAGQIMLSRVVTVVDAINGVTTLERQTEALKQVAVADQLVLTKTDLACDGSDALLAALRRLNPLAPLNTASHGALPASVLFPDIAATSSDALSAAERLMDHTTAEPHHHDEHRHEHVAHAEITTFAIVRQQPVAAVALSLFLEALADHCGADLLRLKGLVCIAENREQPAVIHGVQHVFHPPVWQERWPRDDRRSRIVFITRGISEIWVRALLDAIELEVKELASDTRTVADARSEPQQEPT